MAAKPWQPKREIAKGHESYTIGAGIRACLLVHGIAASPAQMRPLAEYLADSGFAARAMLLPGHGTHPDELRGVVWQDWYERLDDEYRQLRAEHEEVTLIGFSIGAALAMHYAAHNPVERLVLLSLPLCPLNDRYPTGLMLRMYGAVFKDVKGKAERLMNADGEDFCYVYDRVPTAILYTMTELVDIVRRNLERVHSPALIVQSMNDKVSGSKSGPLAYRKICSREKDILMLKRSGHSVMMDVEKEMLFKRIGSFLNGKCSQ